MQAVFGIANKDNHPEIQERPAQLLHRDNANSRIQQFEDHHQQSSRHLRQHLSIKIL